MVAVNGSEISWGCCVPGFVMGWRTRHCLKFFVIKHVLIVIFEIKFVYFVWIFIQILCLVHLRLSTRWNVWFWPSDSSGADGSLFWNCWDTATWCGNASWDSGSWSMIWNVHLISVLVQFIGLNSVMLFRIFRSLMKWPT